MIFEHIASETTRMIERRVLVFREAFGWIRALPTDPIDGITKLRGDNMYVNIHGYSTLPINECRWESHRHTVDLQFCISGGEAIDWLPDVALQPDGEYNAAKDTQKWLSSVSPRVHLPMLPGAYAIFLPNELHRPKVADGSNSAVRKLVVKIHKDLVDL
jgi:biofilm protein TabA